MHIKSFFQRRAALLLLAGFYGTMILLSLFIVRTRGDWQVVSLVISSHLATFIWILALAFELSRKSMSDNQTLRITFRTDELTAEELFNAVQWKESKKPEHLISFLNHRAPNQKGQFDKLPMSQLESLFTEAMRIAENSNKYYEADDDWKL